MIPSAPRSRAWRFSRWRHKIYMVVPSMGIFKVVTLDHMKKMKNNAIVGNIGHFDVGWFGDAGRQEDRHHHASSGPVCPLRWPRCDRAGFRPNFSFWMARVTSCSFPDQMHAQLDLLGNFKPTPRPDILLIVGARAPCLL